MKEYRLSKGWAIFIYLMAPVMTDIYFKNGRLDIPWLIVTDE